MKTTYDSAQLTTCIGPAGDFEANTADRFLTVKVSKRLVDGRDTGIYSVTAELGGHVVKTVHGSGYVGLPAMDMVFVQFSDMASDLHERGEIS